MLCSLIDPFPTIHPLNTLRYHSDRIIYWNLPYEFSNSVFPIFTSKLSTVVLNLTCYCDLTGTYPVHQLRLCSMQWRSKLDRQLHWKTPKRVLQSKTKNCKIEKWINDCDYRAQIRGLGGLNTVICIKFSPIRENGKDLFNFSHYVTLTSKLGFT